MLVSRKNGQFRSGLGRKDDAIGIKRSVCVVGRCSVYDPGSEYAGRGQEFRLTARKYEFSPNKIRVKQGDHVKLIITAVDANHGFKLEAFHIARTLPKGEPVIVEFTAEQTGAFPFECSHFCGLGHRLMKGQLTVE